MTTKIAVIGERESIIPLKALGVEIFPIEKIEEAKKVILDLEIKGYGIVFVTEDLASCLEEVFEEFREKPFPLLVPIPTSHGSTGFAEEEMGRWMRRSLGWEI